MAFVDAKLTADIRTFNERGQLGPDPLAARYAARRAAYSLFARPLSDEAAVGRLAVPDLARLAYVFDAVAAIKRALDGSIPQLGFAGSPFTLACYMIEGHGSTDFSRVRRLLYARPDLPGGLEGLGDDREGRLQAAGEIDQSLAVD